MKDLNMPEFASGQFLHVAPRRAEVLLRTEGLLFEASIITLE